MSKYFFIFFIFCSIFSAQAESLGNVKTHNIVVDKIATGVTAVVKPLGSNRTFQAIGNTSAGAGAATILIEVSNDNINFALADTLSLTLGTTITSDTYETDAAWKYVRANVTAISGTNAKVSVIMGAQL